MKNLYLILVLSALVACTGSSQKEKPACVNTPVEPFTGLPVFDLQEQYPEKEIILQDIADVRYVVLETGDSSLVGIRPILMTDSFLVTVNKKSDVIFFDKSGKYLHSFNHTGMSGEEYGDIVSGYCIDEKAREIFIYDGLQSRIQVYGYGARLNCRKTACLLLRYLSMMKISCLAKIIALSTLRLGSILLIKRLITRFPRKTGN